MRSSDIKEGIESNRFYARGYSSLSDVEKWVVDNTPITEREIRNIKRLDPHNGELALIFNNGEDPYIISLVRGMSDEQLDYFRSFCLNDIGMGELLSLDERWAGDKIRFEHLTERDLVSSHREAANRLFREARGYYVLANRTREVFK